jgi:hypothetical protein
LVLNARQATMIGGSLWQQLCWKKTICPTAIAVRQIQVLGQKYIADEQPKFMRNLYALMLRKEMLVERVRKVIKFKSRQEAWLYLHVPLAVALLATLSVHVVSVLFYW